MVSAAAQTSGSSIVRFIGLTPRAVERGKARSRGQALSSGDLLQPLPGRTRPGNNEGPGLRQRRRSARIALSQLLEGGAGAFGEALMSQWRSDWG